MDGKFEVGKSRGLTNNEELLNLTSKQLYKKIKAKMIHNLNQIGKNEKR